MSTETDFSAAPYFDDFDENKNFHRILFQPGSVVQARELTQMQTILQNQIERFGDNIYTDGTIIKGCNFFFDDSFSYVKLRDLRVDGQATSPDQYVGMRVSSPSSNLQAIVVYSSSGLETQNPDLHTLYVKYQNSGNGGQATFSPEEELNFHANTNPANTTSLVSQYTVQVAPAVINTSNTNPIGKSYVFSVSDGVIFQKGFFVKVPASLSVIVSKYSNSPDNLVVGFSTEEVIITEYDDTSLYDNSFYSNQNAPGAHRLKLSPTLVVANNDSLPADNFFALVEWQNGKVISLKQQTQYGQINREMARRTYEESGNYVVKPFSVISESIASNTTHFNLVTSSGVAFVEGYRVENLNNRGTLFRTGSNIKTVTDQVLNASYGNYVLVDEVVGTFAFHNGAIVSLRDTPGNRISTDNLSPSLPGAEIGTARVISASYDSGSQGTPDAKLRLYLTDIKMNSGYSFSSVKSIAYDEATYDGLADVVLNSSNTAILNDSNKSSLVIPTSKFAVTSVSNIDYVYKTSTQGTTLKIEAVTGSTTLTLGGTQRFPYGTGLLSSTNEAKIIVVPQNSANVATPVKTGTVTATSASNVLTGSATSFVNEYEVNDFISVNGIVRRITAISNNTNLTVNSNWGTNISVANTHAKHYPANIPIGISDHLTSVYLANTSSLSVQLISKTGVNETLSTNANIIIYHDVVSPNASAVAKTVLKDQYVKIDTARFVKGSGYLTSNTSNTTILGTNSSFNTQILAGYSVYNGANALIGTVQSVTNSTSFVLTSNSAVLVSNGIYTFSAPGSVGTTGPWSLGVPDVYKIKNIYRSSNTTYTTTEDVSAFFTLDNGQKDGLYDLSKINLSPDGVGQIKNGDKLLVKFDTFRSAGVTNAGFYTRNSYPIDDVNTANTTAVRTLDIPVYTDGAGNKISLRDSFDFRPQVTNTAVYTSSAGSATVNPSISGSFASGNLYLVSPDQAFTYSTSYNVGRIDKLAISSLGEFVAIEGVPSETPIAPADFNTNMTLSTVYIPPYPSLPAYESITEKRQEHSIQVQTKQNRRYTMKDIANIDNRLSSVEYYTSLNMLENKTNSLVLKSEHTGMDRFKNGIFVDDFSDLVSADPKNIEFRIGYDPLETTIVPAFDQSVLGLKYVSGGQTSGKAVTLPYTEVTYIDQPETTGYRSVTEQIWSFAGTTELVPGYVYLPDLNPNVPALPPTLANYIPKTLNVSFCTDILEGSPFMFNPVVTALDFTSPDPRTEYNSLIEYQHGSSIQPLSFQAAGSAFTTSFNSIADWPFAYFDAPVNSMYDSINRRFKLSAYTLNGKRQPTIYDNNAGSVRPFNSTPGQLASCWWGYITLPGTTSDSWTFYGTHDDGMALYIDNAEVFKTWSDGPARTTSGSKILQGGRAYPFKLYYYNAGSRDSAACILELACDALGVSRQYATYDLFSIPRASAQSNIIPTVSNYFTIPTIAPGEAGGYSLSTQAITDYTKFVKRYAEYGNLNSVAVSKGNYILNEDEAINGIKAAISSGWLTKYGS